MTDQPKLLNVAAQICAARNLQLVRMVGAGAFKETFHVKAVTGSADLALKVHLPGRLSERADREVAAMLKCLHPNIARLYEVDVFRTNSQEWLYSIEEFLPGGTLSDRFRAGILAHVEVLELGSQLIDAVEVVQRERLVHRDIKPDNVMLRADGRTAVLVDFGLVRDLEESSLTATWAPQGPGTPLYSSPEQLMNEKSMIDWRADQFSLGVLLSIGAIGFHPYSETNGDNVAAVQRVAERRPHSARFLAAAQLAQLPALAEMTNPWPVERYRTPNELKAAWEAQRSL